MNWSQWVVSMHRRAGYGPAALPLSYTALVRAAGIEPAASRSQSGRSTGLSYALTPQGTDPQADPRLEVGATRHFSLISQVKSDTALSSNHSASSGAFQIRTPFTTMPSILTVVLRDQNLHTPL